MPGNESYYFFSIGDALFIVLDMEGENYDTPKYLDDRGRNKFWMDISKDYFEKEKTVARKYIGIKYKKIEYFMRIEVAKDYTIMKAIDINGELLEEIKVGRRK